MKLKEADGLKTITQCLSFITARWWIKPPICKLADGETRPRVKDRNPSSTELYLNKCDRRKHANSALVRSHADNTSVCQEVPIMRFFRIWRSPTPQTPPPAATYGKAPRSRQVDSTEFVKEPLCVARLLLWKWPRCFGKGGGHEGDGGRVRWLLVDR